ncbi:DUF1963 domain-containing protein [Streptomyces fuscichromogenes]|uniref:DUF1963 domain-containing protein n=1 Tax=Streptomyces fuscichromogenes TaxID=1324013 RepID=UPI00381714EB
MDPELRDWSSPFPGKAVARGIPARDVERWLATARPFLLLTRHGDGEGPVVGRFGGPLLLPAGTPTPFHPLVASVDLAALPADATDLPLPSDGRLLLFAFVEDEGDFTPTGSGSVVYVPAGTAVAERDSRAWAWSDEDEYQEMVERYPQGPLRATPRVSPPYHWLAELPQPPRWETLPGHPLARELVEVWKDTHGHIATWGSLQIGGHATEEVTESDPVAGAVSGARRAVEAGRRDAADTDSGDVSDWVLLADWHTDIDGWEGATVHWAIQREDLAMRRFDRAFTTVFWNP